MRIRVVDLTSERPTQTALRTERTDPSGLSVVGIRTNKGWRSMDSRYSPQAEARQAAERHRFNGSAILLGGGSGFLIREMIHKGIRQICLLTASHHLARKNISSASKDSHRLEELVIIIADRAGDALFAHLNDCYQGMMGRPEVIQQQREFRAFPSLFNPAAVYLDNLKKPPRVKKRGNPQKILFLCSGQLLEPEIVRALKKRGLQVICKPSLADRNMSSERACSLLYELEPDFVFSINNRGSDRYGLLVDACGLAGVDWATWFLDEPRFSVQDSEIHPAQRRVGFCWDIAGVESCRSLGFSRSELLPLATDPERFFPGEGDPSLKGRIVYVGSPGFGNEKKYFSALINDPAAEKISQALESSIMETRRLPDSYALGEIMAELKMSPDAVSGGALKRIPAYALYRANLKYRIEALSALADLCPVVYGEGWEGLLPDTVEIRNYVDYYNGLSRIYRSDAVHLSLTHLQMRHYPNQRIFDVGACAQITLGERLEGWQQLFGPSFEDLLFSSLDELKHKAALLSGQPQKRASIGRELSELIRSRHSISNRVDKIWELLFESTGEKPHFCH